MAIRLLIGFCKVGSLFGLGWIIFGLANLFLFNCLFDTFEFKEAKIDKLVINRDFDPSLFGIHYEFKVKDERYAETYMIPRDKLLESYESPESIVIIYNTFFPRANNIKGFRQAFPASVMEICGGAFFCLFSLYGIKRIKAKYGQGISV